MFICTPFFKIPYINDIIYFVSVSDLYFTQYISRSIYIAPNGIILFFFMASG